MTPPAARQEAKNVLRQLRAIDADDLHGMEKAREVLTAAFARRERATWEEAADIVANHFMTGKYEPHADSCAAHVEAEFRRRAEPPDANS